MKKKNYREDGRVEIICEHGIGHTTYESALTLANLYEHKIDVWLSHGCDGCCSAYAECKEKKDGRNTN